VKISILGAAGFLGRLIASRLAADGHLGGRPIEAMTLFDASPPVALHADFPVEAVVGDLAALPDAAIPERSNVVFHLAAVVSAAAEADYDLGRRVNLRGTDAVIDRCRALADPLASPPRVVFASSVAAFSGGQTAVIADDGRALPGGSYGAQKAAAELALADASRRGFLDLVCLRLPTVCIRPGPPNAAASGFVSGILREPLRGEPASLPVPDDFAVWITSPSRAVEWLLRAAAMGSETLGLDRGINPPGLTVTVAEMLAALEAVAPGASSLVRREPDAAVAAIVGVWPARFAALRAQALGFSPCEGIGEIVRRHAAAGG
jgi:nucleoside-diphosphate-sugar epimerase